MIIEFLVFFFAVVGLSFLITVPLSGVLVRFRANYTPRRVNLDAEGGAVAPVSISYFGMMARVYRLEGWPGLYKGLMPTLLNTFFASLLLLPFVQASAMNQGKYSAPSDAGIISLVVYSIVILLFLPGMILTYRAIATPHKLSAWDAARGLTVLMSPIERRHPWTLYKTPGLLAAQFLQIVIIIFGIQPLRHFALRQVMSLTNIPAVGTLAIYLAVASLATVFLTPLEVITTRLCIQYNRDEDSTPETNIDPPQYSGTGEDVIELRDGSNPYTSLFDCGRKIVQEEGWRTIYRGWWITLLGAILSGLQEWSQLPL